MIYGGHCFVPIVQNGEEFTFLYPTYCIRCLTENHHHLPLQELTPVTLDTNKKCGTLTHKNQQIPVIDAREDL